MIVSAFPGVGKTTLAKADAYIIDLESSCFNKKDNPNWYIDYCKVAMDLDAQGYTVFVSSHKVVRDYLRFNFGGKYYMVMFDKCMKDYIINRLKARYEASQLQKDHLAYTKAAEAFDALYQEILTDENEGIESNGAHALRVHWIVSSHYSLYRIVHLLLSVDDGLIYRPQGE